MNISYKWLNDLIEIDLAPRALAEQLTLIGLELDGIHQIADDYIFDIEVTSNRGDCLSHLGVAREVSAFSNSEITLPKMLAAVANTEQTDLVTIEDPDLCRRFTAHVIRNVEIGHSPKWLVERLEAIGERSINNVADITNYVMHELGQPMHAFDLDKLSGSSLVVRRARNGEMITTLDEVERKLDPSMLVICDSVKPVAVGGVMGGIDSGITDETTDVLLEVAYFDRNSIRKTSRDLNLSSEASYHFERGVDINNLPNASNRATGLICELAGGKSSAFVDVYPNKFDPVDIEAEGLKNEVKRLSGLEVGDLEIDRILKRLGLEKKGENLFSSPSWRHDLAITEDLVEEVVRIIGYDQVAEELPSALSSGEYQPTESRKRALRRTLANSGFDEAISYSFIDEEHDDKFEFTPNLVGSSKTDKFVTIMDPIIEGSTRMRPSLLSGLLDSVKVNFNQQNRNIKLFEIGKVFATSKDGEGLPNERELMGLVMTGDETFENTALTSNSLDFYDLKGAVDLAVTSINSKSLEYREREVKHLQNGQSAELFLDDSPVGFVGRLKDDIASTYKFKQPVYVAEIDLQKVLANAENPSTYTPLPVFPGISRDVSFRTKRSLPFAAIQSEIESLGLELCRKISFVDVFEGKGMSDSERSVTIRLQYRSDERTLTEDEVEKVHEVILQTLDVNLGVKLR